MGPLRQDGSSIAHQTVLAQQNQAALDEARIAQKSKVGSLYPAESRALEHPKVEQGQVACTLWVIGCLQGRTADTVKDNNQR